jgi:hypothetical protein
MGNDCRVTLAEGWPVLGPLIAQAMATGVASWVPALQLLLDRAGYREEAYFSVSHAPAKDDDGVTRGVLTVCSEVTEQVVGERRLQLLRDLSLSEDRTESVQDTADRVVSTVSAHALDVPFVALYALEGGALRRIASAGPELPGLVRPQDPDPWQLRAGLTATTHVQVPAAAGAAVGGAWGDPVTQALALPCRPVTRQRRSACCWRPSRPAAAWTARTSPSSVCWRSRWASRCATRGRTRRSAGGPRPWPSSTA